MAPMIRASPPSVETRELAAPSAVFSAARPSVDVLDSRSRRSCRLLRGCANRKSAQYVGSSCEFARLQTQ
eukprot:6200403-Pleurochrysis_carterae.AAC.1